MDFHYFIAILLHYSIIGLVVTDVTLEQYMSNTWLVKKVDGSTKCPELTDGSTGLHGV